MASRADLIAALRSADAAGDTSGAQRIAAMIRAAPADAPVTLGGMAKSFGSGLLNGAVALGNMGRLGANPDLIQAETQGGRWLATHVGGQSQQQADAGFQQAENVRRAVLGPTTTEAQQAAGLYHAPQNEPERIANTVGQFVPNAFGGGGAGLVARGARVVIPALASEGARAATQAAGGNAFEQGMAQVVGGGVGGLVGDVTNIPRAVGQKVLTMGREAVPGNTAALADTAINTHLIPLRSDQIAAAGGDKAAGIRDSNLVSTNKNFQASQLAQKQAFTNAVAKTFGAEGPLTTDAMAQARNNLSDGFQAHAANNGIAADDQLTTDLAKVGSQARELGLSDNEIGAIDKQISSITDLASSHAESGIIPGSAYQSLTQSGSTLSKIMNAPHGSYGNLGADIKTALSDAAGRVSPEASQQLADLRSQWANMKTVEPLAEKAGPEGLISPPLLQGRVNATFDNAAYGSGSALKELGDIGQTFMKEPSTSNTSERLLDRVKAPAAYAAMGADALQGFHDPGAALTGAAAMATGYGAAKAMGALKAARSNNAFATGALLNQPPVSIVNLSAKNALLPAAMASDAAITQGPSPGP